MAITVTLAISTGSASNLTSYPSGAFTPAVGDVLVVFTSAPAEATQAATMTGTGDGLTFTKVQHALRTASADISHMFISNQFVSAAASQTVTVDYGADAATGCNITVLRVAGTLAPGTACIRQSAKQDNGAAAGTASVTLGSTPLTVNTLLGHLGNGANPAAVTQPATWTESSDSGSATPASGNECCHVITGYTTNPTVWGSTSATAFGAIVAEIDGVANLQPQSIM